jgi:hypothetical protein
MITKPKSHIVDSDLSDISVARQAEHLYYVSQHFIPTQHLIVGIVPIQDHAMWVITASQDTPL